MTRGDSSIIMHWTSTDHKTTTKTEFSEFFKPFVLKQNEKLLNFPFLCLFSLSHYLINAQSLKRRFKNKLFLLSTLLKARKEKCAEVFFFFFAFSSNENLEKENCTISCSKSFRGMSRKHNKSFKSLSSNLVDNVPTLSHRSPSHQWFNRLQLFTGFCRRKCEQQQDKKFFSSCFPEGKMSELSAKR